MPITAEELLRLAKDPTMVAMVLASAQGQGLVQQNAQQQKDNWTTTFGALSNPTMYGRNSFLDPCYQGDMFGLQTETHGILSWLGWRKNPFWKKTVQFITWWRGAGADEGTTGAGSPCEDPTGWEWGECSYDMCHTSWYHRQGDPLGPHNVQNRCLTSQRVRMNGTVITDDWEWQLNGILQALKQDVNWDVVHGSHLNSWEMNGLESIIRTGYTDNNGNPCPMVDSWLIDWLNDDLDGAINGWGNFFDMLHELVNLILRRARPIGRIRESDMVLFTQPFMADCLLDAFACYSVCGVNTQNDRTDQALRAQILAYRNSLNGGPLYDGEAAVGFLKLKNGRRVPIMVDETFDITKPGANYCTDIYLMTRRIGNRDVFYGEYLDLAEYANRMRKFTTNNIAGIRVEAGGRFAFRGKMDNWCGMAMAGISPELYLSAPWAQARIMNVCCYRRFKPEVGTPFQQDYLPGGAQLYPASSYGMPCTDVPGDNAGATVPVP
jgi:hypothetical protein